MSPTELNYTPKEFSAEDKSSGLLMANLMLCPQNTNGSQRLSAEHRWIMYICGTKSLIRKISSLSKPQPKIYYFHQQPQKCFDDFVYESREWPRAKNLQLSHIRRKFRMKHFYSGGNIFRWWGAWRWFRAVNAAGIFRDSFTALSSFINSTLWPQPEAKFTLWTFTLLLN